MAKTPVISVIERRLQGPSVFRESSPPIPLKEPKKWTARWASPTSRPNRLWDMINVQGWVYAELDDLACGAEEIGALVEDSRIVKGERGQREILMKQSIKDHARVQQKKTEETIKQTFGKKQLKEAIVGGAAASMDQGGLASDRAAEFLAKNVNVVSVNDARGPVDE